MSGLTERLSEPLGTTDKRIVTLVGGFFLVAFVLVNWGRVREVGRGCTEVGYLATFGPAVQGGVTVPGEPYVSTTQMLVCPGLGGPTTGEVLLAIGAKMPSLLVSAIALILLARFLWGAARPGLHSPVTPGRLRTLGWFVLIAGPVSEAVQHHFSYELAEELAAKTAEFAGKPAPAFNGWHYWAWMQELQLDFPWWAVFAGVAALVVAKLLRLEVRLAEDLEGTI